MNWGQPRRGAVQMPPSVRMWRLAAVAALALVDFAWPRVAIAQEPDLRKYETLVARTPFSVLVNGEPQTVPLGPEPRRHQFAPATRFGGGEAEAAGIATALAGHPRQLHGGNGVYWGADLDAAGVPGRVYLANGATRISYQAGDLPVAGRARTQVSSYAVPSREPVAWELEFTLGDALARSGWPLSRPGLHPVTIWELKAADGQPSLAISADTSPSDPARVVLVFGRRSNATNAMVRLAESTPIAPFERVRVVMQAWLDERELAAGGRGYWRVWVNGVNVLETAGPNLNIRARTPHQWFLATYLYQDPKPLQESWSVDWWIARLAIGRQ